MLSRLCLSRWFGGHLLAVCVALFVTVSGCRGPAVITEEVPEVRPPRPAVAVVPGRQPHLAEAHRAPHLTQLLKDIGLRYDPEMTPEKREADFAAKVTLLKERTGLRRLVEMRHRSLDVIQRNGGEVSWESLRRLKWADGAPVGVTLVAPVWVPSQARPVKTYAGFMKEWKAVAVARPRPSGFLYHAPSLKDVNDKTNYRAATISFEVNSALAPYAALLLEYIFREGAYQPDKRVPLLVVRGGEDTYAASSATGPATMEALSFRDENGGDFDAQVVQQRFDNYAVLYHGRHAVASNHRLGCALDLNDFNITGATNGNPNPISQAARQHQRDTMHRLDARNLPEWVYRAAGKLGYRLPQQWTHVGRSTDWPHLDCGTK